MSDCILVFILNTINRQTSVASISMQLLGVWKYMQLDVLWVCSYTHRDYTHTYTHRNILPRYLWMNGLMTVCVRARLHTLLICFVVNAFFVDYAFFLFADRPQTRRSFFRWISCVFFRWSRKLKQNGKQMKILFLFICTKLWLRRKETIKQKWILTMTPLLWEDAEHEIKNEDEKKKKQRTSRRRIWSGMHFFFATFFISIEPYQVDFWLL